MTPAQFADAIGMVESNGNPNAVSGDYGRARGRFQWHPDALWAWAKRLTLAPQLNETWDSFEERVVEGFYTFHCGENLTAVQIAMTFHRGHVMRENDPEWLADDYASRFSDAARTV